MGNSMNYKKIIPCLDLKNPVSAAKFYNDAGADEIAFFDSKATREGREPDIYTIREICKSVDIPLIACGGVKNLEDVKKILYAGASKVCMKSAALNTPSLVTDAADRFGSERIICTIDLSECQEPVEYAQKLRELGAGELLLIHNNMVPDYLDIVKEIRNKVALPVIVSTYSTNGEAVAEMLKETNAESISLYNLAQMDVMDIKQQCREANIDVNLFEPTMSFEDFKLNSDGLLPCVTQHYKTGEVLMVAYMNKESFDLTVKTGRMVYWSRSRQELWMKGETSGHFQYVKSLTIDCDKDTLLAKVSQVGAACHTGSPTCFFTDIVKKEYNDTNPLKVFEDEYNIICDRKDHPKEGSYTNYLFDKGIDKILKKVGEEATEIVIAAKNPDSEELKYEISDFLYHLMVLMVERGLSWKDITDELADRR
jgi:phosphoribosyl-ATP pyrophosphohydrolase/phosphoribosyl-AMP cyclohydrolase